MDSQTAGMDEIVARTKAELKRELGEVMDPVIDKFVRACFDLTRQMLLGMLAGGEPPKHLTINPLSPAVAEDGPRVQCLFPGCKKPGSKTKRNFCDDHAASLNNKEKETHIKAHQETMRDLHNKKRRDRRKQKRSAG